MSLRDTLGQYVPMLARKPTLPREKSLALRPTRNPAVQWERSEGEDNAGMPGVITLRVPLKQDGIARLLTRWLSMPGSKTIELDEFGSALWEMCDGGHTVEQFVQHTVRAYQLNRRQAEVSVLAFMRMLLERRLVGFYEADLKEENHVGSNTAVRPRRKRQQRTQHARR